MAFEEFLANLPMDLLGAESPAPERPAGMRERLSAAASAGSADGNGAEAEPALALPIQREAPKVGRNEPCPCGSGKKFKNCCGRTA
jgi:preprotein translocase subunit SecA